MITEDQFVPINRENLLNLLSFDLIAFTDELTFMEQFWFQLCSINFNWWLID